MEPIQIDDKTAIGIEVVLPKTTLIAIRTDKGYIMCGALDVRLLNEKLSDRGNCRESGRGAQFGRFVERPAGIGYACG